jgi:hypothetical protein
LTTQTLAKHGRGAYLEGWKPNLMSRTRHPRKTQWSTALYLVLAALFGLRCSVAWAAIDLPSPPSFQSVRANLPPAQSRVVAVAAVKLAPARCESASGDPPAPSPRNLTTLRWSIPAAPASDPSAIRGISAPAPLPPARGPPRLPA